MVCVVSLSLATKHTKGVSSLMRNEEGGAHRCPHALIESLRVLLTSPDRSNILCGGPASKHGRELWTAKDNRWVYMERTSEWSLTGM